MSKSICSGLFALSLFTVAFTACHKSESQSEKPFAQTALEKKSDPSRSQMRVLDTLAFKGAMANPDSLIHAFMDFVLQGKGQEAYALLPTLNEYTAIYPNMPDSDPDPDSPRMMATMLVSSNNKELRRWLELAKGYQSLSRYVLGPVEKQNGYELISKVKIFLKDSTGRESEFPIFRTLIKVGSGYKIWLLLET